VAAFGLGAASMVLLRGESVGPADGSSGATAATTSIPVVTGPPEESQLEPLVAVSLDEVDGDPTAWAAGPIRADSALFLRAADRDLLVADGVLQWSYALEATPCATTSAEAEWDCQPTPTEGGDVRYVAGPSDDVWRDITANENGVWTSLTGGTWAWLDVPAAAEYVALQAGTDVRWQRPVNGVAVFAQGEETIVHVAAVDDEGRVFRPARDPASAGWTLAVAGASVDVPLVVLGESGRPAPGTGVHTGDGTITVEWPADLDEDETVKYEVVVVDASEPRNVDVDGIGATVMPAFIECLDAAEDDTGA